MDLVTVGAGVVLLVFLAIFTAMSFLGLFGSSTSRRW